MRIIVLDCFTRMGLAVINALDPQYQLVGGEVELSSGGAPRRDQWLRSPRLEAVFRYPGPARDEAGFRDAVVAACRRYDVDAVFPTSSASAIALSRLKSDMGAEAPATFICEDYDKLSLLADKWSLYKVALELGIPTPRTILPASLDVDEVLALGLPLVAKPRLGEASLGVRFVASPEELEELVRTPPRIGIDLDGEYPYIFQEHVAGEIHNVGGCAQDGEYVSLLTNKHLLERFEHGGPGIVHITTRVPEVMKYASMLAARTSWSGPLHFNFILDKEGRYLLTDCNPRVWGSIELAVAAGVNACQQAVDVMAHGRRLQPEDGYRVGLVSKWLTPGSLTRCFHRPRSLRAITSRLWRIFDPRRPTVSNLRVGNFRHLTAMVLDTAVRRRRRTRGPQSRSPVELEGDSRSSAMSP
jgi:ATP-grasp domain-containing protein